MTGAARRKAIVVLGHGVTSHLGRPWMTELAEAMAGSAIAALEFSFAGNGGSEGRFEDATLAKEVEDLGAVLDALEAAGRGPIAYVGHSMGAAIGVMRAATDRRIAALVSLAGMVHVHAFMQRHFSGLKPGGPMLGKPQCPWNENLAADAARIGSLEATAARITVPWLLVHGDADEFVPLRDAVAAVQSTRDRARLVPLQGADHRFTRHTSTMSETVRAWLVPTVDQLSQRSRT